MICCDKDFAAALEPWDGRWFVPLPPSGPQFVSIHQHTALQILRGREGINNADARFLQVVATQTARLSEMQQCLLSRLSSEHDERIAA